MSEFTVAKLVEKINSRHDIWEIEGAIIMEYQFLDHTKNQSNTFLSLQIGHHFGMFNIVNNKIALAIGNIDGGVANPRRVWLIDAVARTLLIGILMDYISPRFDSVPPYMLFPMVCREFFDSVMLELRASKSVVDFNLSDVNQPDRRLTTDHKL